MTIGLLGVLGVLASIFAIIAPLFFSRRIKAYSSVRNTLSELGAQGCAQQQLVAFYYFLPLSLATALFLMGVHHQAIAPPGSLLSLWLMGLVSVGYCVAAFFPCDPGAPVGGSRRNRIHNIAGFFEYLGAGVGLLLLGTLSVNDHNLTGERAYLITSGSVILLVLVLLFLPFFNRVRGLLQRIAEYSFFGWMLVISLSLLVRGSG